MVSAVYVLCLDPLLLLRDWDESFPVDVTDQVACQVAEAMSRSETVRGF
jgi:hypothetical protein